MSDVERDPVVVEVMRLLNGAPHGTYTALARAAGLKAPESVRQWALGENRPPKKRWPAIERYFELPPGHLAKIANEAPPIVVELSSPDVDELRRETQLLRERLDAVEANLGEVDGRVRGQADSFEKQMKKLVDTLEAIARQVGDADR